MRSKIETIDGRLYRVTRYGEMTCTDPLSEFELAQLARLKVLEEFFETVCDLTSNHDGIHFRTTDGANQEKVGYDVAVVYPSKLGPALEKVDPEWWKPKKKKGKKKNA